LCGVNRIQQEKGELLMAKNSVELMRGTLDLLILRTLELQPLHGVAVSDRIEQVTGGTFVVQAGSLFPALHRLEHQGWIAGEWIKSGGTRRKCYSLTSAGRRKLAAEKRDWRRVVEAMARVLREA
jgi:transcriptional regulator